MSTKFQKFDEFINEKDRTGLEVAKDKKEKLEDWLKRTQKLEKSAKDKNKKNRADLYKDKINYIEDLIDSTEKRIDIEKKKEELRDNE